MTESIEASEPGKTRKAFRIPRFGRLETVVIRIAFAAVVYQTLLTVEDVSLLNRQPSPTGIAHWIDLTWLSSEPLFEWFRCITIGALILYGFGFLMPIALPILLLGQALPLTLYYSQGAVHHDKQVVSLILLAQCLVYLGGWVSRVAKRPLRFPDGIRLSDAAIGYSQQVIAAVYVISGFQKIFRTRGLWPWQSNNLAVEILKTNGQKYHNYLDNAIDHERYVALAQWMADNPMLVRIGASGVLLLEVFAFLALANRTAATVFGILLIAMHQVFGVTMGLYFVPNQWCCLIFLVNVPFWLGICRARLRKGNQILQ
jgi:hypothetical protein